MVVNVYQFGIVDSGQMQIAKRKEKKWKSHDFQKRKIAHSWRLPETNKFACSLSLKSTFLLRTKGIP